MDRPVLARMLRPFGEVRGKEAVTALLMFLYSFLAMTAYNVIKPATRSKFIESVGADNLPYVQLVAGLAIGVIMGGYSWLVSRLPRRYCLPITQGGIAVLLLVFWYLFRTGQVWVSLAFYLVGLILGVLIISQFWTLANVVFDPRQAKRLFGFVGGGSSLGGILGSLLAERYVKQIGTSNLLLFSVAFMVPCIATVALIVRREQLGEGSRLAVAASEKGIGGKEAIDLLRQSRHLRIIALVISFAAVGAAIIDQQLNMAAEAAKGQQATDAITAFLARVQLWTSMIGFLVQVLLTSRIHRYLGIGFALLLLPMSLGTSALVMLFNAALWAPAVARVLDQSLRYSVDKTTREILYMPLPSDLKFAAKPFVDVTVDRFAKAIAAVLMLVLIQPWGLDLNWQRLSYVSVVMTGIWIMMALRARREYQAEFRQSIATREIKPAEVDSGVADLSTIETLMEELASPDERRVLYAIDFLEALDKKNLVTPLLLYHESPAVRARALSVIRAIQPEISARWLPAIQGMMRDENPEVRSAAVGALASMRHQQVGDLVRPLLQDRDPRIMMTAAMVLAGSDREEDVASADAVLTGLVSDTRESAAPVRRELAIAIRHVRIPHFRRLLIPLLSDPDAEVAEEAMSSTRTVGAADFVFVPTLISLLRDGRQKGSARELLVGHGEPLLAILRHFLRDPEEDIWVRRQIPATIARIPCQKAMDILIEALAEADGFLRFNVIAALERVHRIRPQLPFDRGPVETMIINEGVRYFEYRSLYRRLFEKEGFPKQCLLARALTEKMKRGVDRIYRLLTLLYPWKDIAAARHAIERGEARSQAGALEYLDNVLTGVLRKTLIPLLEETTAGGEGVGTLKQSYWSVENAAIRLVNDEDAVISATAIYFLREQGLSNFVDELDRVLVTRDVRDRCVLEAASWVLAGFRMPGPKYSWLELLPAVDLAERMRRMPLFASITVDELFRICDAGRQVRCEPGRLLCQEALIPEEVVFLLDGRVALKNQAGGTRQLEAPAALGFEELLEDNPMVESARTVEAAVCLTLAGEEIRLLLADNAQLVSGLFQMVCSRSDQTVRLVVRGNPSEQGLPVTGSELKPIEKGLVLKTVPLFSDVSPQDMIALATVASEVRLLAGSQLFSEADPPALYALVSGELCIESLSDGPPLHAGPSDVIGLYETLAGIGLECRARVTAEGIALRIDREDLFDLLAQRSGLLRQIFSTLFRMRAARKMAAET